jgi:hypothetical protein
MIQGMIRPIRRITVSLFSVYLFAAIFNDLFQPGSFFTGQNEIYPETTKVPFTEPET